ncbi:MAG: regulator [delta proteobacterium ML8_F1]|nr:MAG: regulator [delta proteobacterium ML8_F1]
MKNRILIIDDEEAIGLSLAFALEDHYEVEVTTDPRAGLNWILKKTFDLVLLDLRIGKVDGIDILREIKTLEPDLQVVIMTAYGTIDSTVEAMKTGAFTYLTKPLKLDILEKTVQEALKARKVVPQTEKLPGENLKYGIIGKSRAMQEVFHYIDKLKDVDTSVVIEGESGTGKELIARAIHFAGKRRDKKFVAINCAAIPENLLEEELFGHKKGTFTGAVADKMGRLEYANGGTVLLDEIGELPLPLQSKLLRVIQQKEFSPLGSNQTVSLDVRFVAATNQNLDELVEKGAFRKDLIYRLKVFSIKIMPLRERVEDLEPLLNCYVGECNRKLDKNIRGFSSEALKLLMGYSYPGNVRELINIIEYSVLMAGDELIRVDNLPINVQQRGDRPKNPQMQGDIENLAGLTLQEAEKHLIVAALEINEGHQKKTAKMLGISERGLRYKLEAYGLKQ